MDKEYCAPEKAILLPKEEKELLKTAKADANVDKPVVTKRSRQRRAVEERKAAKSEKKLASKNHPSKRCLRDKMESDKEDELQIGGSSV